MTAHERVRSARWLLATAVIASSLLWAAATFAASIGIIALADWTFGLPRSLRMVATAMAVALGGAVGILVIWRGRTAWSLHRVALWLEERVPQLRYALVTALEQGSGAAGSPLDKAVRQAFANRVSPVPAVALRAVARPAVVGAAAFALLIALPAGVVARVRHPAVGDALSRRAHGATASRSRLAPIVVTITPPAYSSKSPVTLEDPGAISALVGSRVTVDGRGSPTGLAAAVGDSSAKVADAGQARWRVAFAMPRAPTGLRLRDGAADRLLVLEPQPDSSPVVTLAQPARDSVVRHPSGQLALAATAHDDFGLDAAWFELIVSSGEGEKFTFRSTVIGRQSVGGSRDVALHAALSLDSLALGPGDIVHIRAVGRDRNDVTGPGIGSSDTRTLRIPRPSEYDSVAVEAAPPPDVQQSQLSERMLIMLAEALVKRRSSLPHATVVEESRGIGLDQTRLRKHVGNVIFARLGPGESGEESEGADTGRAGNMSPEELLAAADSATRGTAGAATDFAADESPVVAVNRPLLEAYNAMWDASRSLDIGEPAQALPHMRAALAAIQRARDAERLYLRGKTPVVVVDLAKVRLSGKRDDTAPAARTPRQALDSTSARRAVRLERALDLLASAPSAALDSLLALRIDALAGDTALAAALAQATDAMRAGHDATAALLRARRVAEGGEPREQSVFWGGSW